MADSGNIYRRERNTHAMESLAMNHKNVIEPTIETNNEEVDRTERFKAARKQLTYNQNKSIREEMLSWAKIHLDKHERKRSNPEYYTDVKIGDFTIRVTRDIIKDTYHHNKVNKVYQELMEDFKTFKTWMKKMVRQPDEQDTHGKGETYIVFRLFRKNKKDIKLECKETKGDTKHAHFMIYYE